jgi:predicted AAA+ superfamily ATPase
MNGQVVNVAGIARDAGVARPTVQRYFDTLVGTLIGSWLPAWKPRRKVKEVAHPKFYFFDTGVVRALLGRLREPLEGAERGHLLETLVFHELRARIAYSGSGGELSYWGTPSRSELDFVWTRGARAVGIEVKSSKEWRREHGRVLAEAHRRGVIQSGFGVYLGREPQRGGKVECSHRAFLASPARGSVLPLTSLPASWLPPGGPEAGTSARQRRRSGRR